jgi:hypothetical protein
MRSAPTPRVYTAMAGFEAGMVAVLAMLGWLGLVSAWYRHSLWTPANVMASCFYGNDALGPALSWKSLSGIAFYLIAYSLFGALFALVIGEGLSRRRLFLIGILTGAAWYYLWFGLLWPQLNPLVTLYTHDRPMLWGHFLFGAMLGRFPRYVARLAAGEPPSAEPQAVLYTAEQQQNHQDQQNQAE